MMPAHRSIVRDYFDAWLFRCVEPPVNKYAHCVLPSKCTLMVPLGSHGFLSCNLNVKIKKSDKMRTVVCPRCGFISAELREGSPRFV